MTTRVNIPDGVPVLSAGKHRRPQQGACFMEMVSYLAGEKWSDHPRCTHPLLSTMARLVNDELSHRARQRITRLIPSVVGLNPDHWAATPTLVRCAALAALPVAAADTQNLMALALVNAEAHLAGDHHPTPATLSPRSRQVLADVPATEEWVWRHIAKVGARRTAMDGPIAAEVIRLAVVGIADACTPDADDRLVALLEGAVAALTSLEPESPPSPTPMLDPTTVLTREQLLERDDVRV